jgi:hypothetical protein
MNIFDSYIEAGHELDRLARAEFYLALIEYIAYGTEPEFKKAPARAIFTAIRPSLDISKQRSQSGKRGMQKRYQNASPLAGLLPNKTANKQLTNELTSELTNGLTKSNSKSNRKDTLSNESVKKSGKRFSAPSVGEVQDYVNSLDGAKYRKSQFNAQRFCDYYSAKGWVVGKSPMKDWKAAVRTWLGRENSWVSEVTSDNGKFAEYV